MRLHAERKVTVDRLERLESAGGRSRGEHRSVAEPGYRLVLKRVHHVAPDTEDATEPGLAGYGDLARRLRSRFLLPLENAVSDHIGEMLAPLPPRATFRT